MPGQVSTYSSNRGMTLYPEQRYQELVNYYTPAPQHVGGGSQVGGGQQSGAGMYNGFPLSIYNFGGGQQQQAPGGYHQPLGRRDLPNRGPGHGNRFGTGAPGTVLQNGGGAGGAGGGAGGVIPPATTQPQVPIDGSGGTGSELQNLLGNYTNPITAGQLSNDAIQRAMSTLGAGSPAWAQQAYGGNFADNMSQNLGRAGINLSRGASEQQAAMDLAYQKAHAGAGLDMAGLLQQLNSQNVNNSTQTQSQLLQALMGLFSGVQ